MLVASEPREFPSSGRTCWPGRPSLLRRVRPADEGGRAHRAHGHEDAGRPLGLPCRRLPRLGRDRGLGRRDRSAVGGGDGEASLRRPDARRRSDWPSLRRRRSTIRITFFRCRRHWPRDGDRAFMGVRRRPIVRPPAPGLRAGRAERPEPGGGPPDGRMATMARTVVIVEPYDTKGVDFRFVKELVEGGRPGHARRRLRVMGPPAFRPDVSREEVAAQRVPTSPTWPPATTRTRRWRRWRPGWRRWCAGVRRGRVDGIRAWAQRRDVDRDDRHANAPRGRPKVMVSTLGGGDVSAFAGTKDITFIAVDRRTSRLQPAQPPDLRERCRRHRRDGPAGAPGRRPRQSRSWSPPCSANTTAAVDHAKGIIEARGYEVLVFHATGTAAGRWRASSPTASSRLRST